MYVCIHVCMYVCSSQCMYYSLVIWRRSGSTRPRTTTPSKSLLLQRRFGISSFHEVKSYAAYHYLRYLNGITHKRAYYCEWLCMQSCDCGIGSSLSLCVHSIDTHARIHTLDLLRASMSCIIFSIPHQYMHTRVITPPYIPYSLTRMRPPTPRV